MPHVDRYTVIRHLWCQPYETYADQLHVTPEGYGRGSACWPCNGRARSGQACMSHGDSKDGIFLGQLPGASVFVSDGAMDTRTGGHAI